MKLVASLLVALGLVAGATPAAAAPDGQMTWAVHVSLAPVWFDPAETPGLQTPFMILYALHDAMVKPMPGNAMAPSLAESWNASKDGLTYEFVLRQGVRFHNGDAVTGDDVKFSFERYRGVAAKFLKEKVAAVEVVDPQRVRFRLKAPWPDFMTYYGSLATGAGWVVPKKYVQRVGDDGFKKQPVGAGPYRFVSFTPGVELTVEANEHYWRKVPSVKRLVLKVAPDASTRLAMLKRGEADIVYGTSGEIGEEVRRSPGLTLRSRAVSITHWLLFADQWDPKSPWHDRRVRLAASYALDRQAINEAQSLGFSKITWSIVPSTFDFYWQPPSSPHDPARARQLLAEAGYPGGLDAGDLWCDAGGITPYAEAVLNQLHAAGIRAKLRPLERAAFQAAYREKKLRNLVYSNSGSFGNAASRIEAFVAAGGAYVLGSYGDIDGLFREQAAELDRKKRETILHRIQQLAHDKAMHAPLWELAVIHASGPRVAESGVGLIPAYAWSAPYEDVRLK